MTRDEFTKFYAGNKDRCLRAAIAYGIAPDRAEEAVAEAFARAWSRWPSVRSADSPRAWVVRTAINADISWWRRRRREVVTEPPERPAATHDLDTSSVLIEAVRRLPPRQREVVVHRYLLDLDTATTARALGIAPGTAKALLHHALATLRAELTFEGNPS
ncbi:sigma-70 family RNA polymerase sigma factor [Nocardioides sp. KC13]|uniref:Sigma-70 family RNA polymerase sigma factor n=1 Tax=Nocardioides turkmenicus TaxID=2711220 RepID=A0A6M1R0N1_9ACTN|nr:sigma-70 family RNA polymerase sigma factor [Nocardioides sp. KC13]